MKRSIDYRFRQKVNHGEVGEITFYSPEETIVFKSNNTRHREKRIKYKQYRKESEFDSILEEEIQEVLNSI